jgi:hypothetical protein
MDRLQIWLRTTSPEAQSTKIYFSGIVLAEGEFPQSTPPALNSTASAGTWGNSTFINIARNSFFSQPWPYLRPEISQWVNKSANGVGSIAVSSFFALFLDTPGTNWYLTSTAARIFRTFWAMFGWGQIDLVTISWAPRPYLYLLILTGIGGLAGLICTFHLFKDRKSEIIFLDLIAIVTVIVALFYGIYTMGGALRFRAYLPVARYIFPAMIPIALLVISGWYAISLLVIQKARISPKWPVLTGIFLMILLNVYSIFSIVKYTLN